MAAQLLIYEHAVPLSSVTHANWSVEVGTQYGFTRRLNSVPLMALEFPIAAPEYPIVFAGGPDTIMPVVILGVRAQENLFLAKDDTWLAIYMPAFVRRYPFVFSTNADKSSFTLCIDEAFPGFNQTGRGQRLFDEQGKASPYVTRVLGFLKEYQTQFQRTEAFCAKLKDAGLLDPMQAEVKLVSGTRSAVTGFQVVNRERLKALPGDKLAELAKTDELELIYLHLQSMRNFGILKDRLAAAEAAKPVPEVAAAEAGQPESLAPL